MLRIAPAPPDVISCHFRWSTPSHCVASCRLMPVVRAATEHRSSTAVGRRCSTRRTGGGAVEPPKQRTFRPLLLSASAACSNPGH